MPEFWGKRHDNLMQSLENITQNLSEFQKMKISFDDLNSNIVEYHTRLRQKEKNLDDQREKLEEILTQTTKVGETLVGSKEKTLDITDKAEYLLSQLNAQFQKMAEEEQAYRNREEKIALREETFEKWKSNLIQRESYLTNLEHEIENLVKKRAALTNEISHLEKQREFQVTTKEKELVKREAELSNYARRLMERSQILSERKEILDKKEIELEQKNADFKEAELTLNQKETYFTELEKGVERLLKEKADLEATLTELRIRI